MQTKETTKKELTKMGEMGWWLHVDADECKEKIKKVLTCRRSKGCGCVVLRAMLHGYAGADVDGCGCGCPWMWMDADVDVHGCGWMRMRM